VPPPERPGRHHLTRADLPEEFTPDSLRHLGLRQLGQLRRANHVLDPAEQAQFNTAFDALLVEVKNQLQDADGRAGRGGPRGLDPDMRRSYARTQQRLQEQARRARAALPQLDEPDGTGQPPSEQPSVDEPTPTEEDSADDVSADSLSEEIEESSTMLELLDRIATIEEQSLEHQKSQLLLDTRGFFFAFLVSVSVIIAGVAPLVEAEPHDRLLILMWTGLAIVLAALVYAGVRAAQRRK
jgi:hypothetical protein